jgi:hypothetical protein
MVHPAMTVADMRPALRSAALVVSLLAPVFIDPFHCLFEGSNTLQARHHPDRSPGADAP